MKRKVVVTQDDIDNGERFASMGCPLARRLRAMGYISAHVTSEEIIMGNSWGRRLPLSTAAKRFIHGFDGGRSTQPSTFILDLPPLEESA